MAESLARPSRKANLRRARAFPKSGNSLHKILPFELWARAVWPAKSVDALHDITGASVRACKYWLAGRYDPSFADVVAILRSEDGFSFLQHVMGQARPKWWRGIAKARDIGVMRRELEEQRRRIEQLELSLD